MSRTKCDLQWSCHWSHLWLGNALLCIPRFLHNSNTCTSARFLQQQMIKLHQLQFSETLHKCRILQTFIDFPVTIVIIELVFCFGAKDKVTDILKTRIWQQGAVPLVWLDSYKQLLNFAVILNFINLPLKRSMDDQEPIHTAHIEGLKKCYLRWNKCSFSFALVFNCLLSLLFLLGLPFFCCLKFSTQKVLSTFQLQVNLAQRMQTMGWLAPR